MNGMNEKTLAEMTDAEIISFALTAEGEYLQDDSSSVDLCFWILNS